MHQLHYGNIISIGTGRWISCRDLYEKLCTAECDSCGDFGGYLYLITCRRVCFLCFTEEPDYLPLLRADAIRKFGLHNEHMARLPAMKTVPAWCSPYDHKRHVCPISREILRQPWDSLHLETIQPMAVPLRSKPPEITIANTREAVIQQHNRENPIPTVILTVILKVYTEACTKSVDPR
jgi:hypothetical protein